jgi:hypothetical protein
MFFAFMGWACLGWKWSLHCISAKVNHWGRRRLRIGLGEGEAFWSINSALVFCNFFYVHISCPASWLFGNLGWDYNSECRSHRATARVSTSPFRGSFLEWRHSRESQQQLYSLKKFASWVVLSCHYSSLGRSIDKYFTMIKAGFDSDGWKWGIFTILLPLPPSF